MPQPLELLFVPVVEVNASVAVDNQPLTLPGIRCAEGARCFCSKAPSAAVAPGTASTVHCVRA